MALASKYRHLLTDDTFVESPYPVEAEAVKKRGPVEFINMMSIHKVEIFDESEIEDFEPWVVNRMLGSLEPYIAAAEQAVRMNLPKLAMYQFWYGVLPESKLYPKLYKTKLASAEDRLRRNILMHHLEVGLRDVVGIIDAVGAAYVDENVTVFHPDWIKKKKPTRKP